MTETVTKELEPDEIVEVTVNDGGQIYLGREHAGKTVTVAYEIHDDE